MRARALAAVTLLVALAFLGCDRAQPPSRAAPPPASAPRTLDEASVADLAREVDAAKAKLRYVALLSPT